MLDLSQQIPHKMLKTFLWENVMYGKFLTTEVFFKLRRGGRTQRPAKFYISHLARRGGYYPPVVKPHRLLFCHSERVKRVEESLLLSKHKFFYAALALLLAQK